MTDIEFNHAKVARESTELLGKHMAQLCMTLMETTKTTIAGMLEAIGQFEAQSAELSIATSTNLDARMAALKAQLENSAAYLMTGEPLPAKTEPKETDAQVVARLENEKREREFRGSKLPSVINRPVIINGQPVQASNTKDETYAG